MGGASGAAKLENEMYMDDILGFLAFLVGITITVIACVFGIGSLVYFVGTRPACEQYGRLENAEISTQFFGAGCLVKYEGRWVDYDVAVRKKQEIKITE